MAASNYRDYEASLRDFVTIEGHPMTTETNEQRERATAEVHAFGCNREAKYGTTACKEWCGQMDCPTSDPIKQHADEYQRAVWKDMVGDGYDYNGRMWNESHNFRSGFIAGYRKAAALLAADAQRVEARPMTEEEVAKTMTDFGYTGIPFATVVRMFRLCEAAHGIKEKS